MNLIVPFAMEFVWFQYNCAHHNCAHLGIRHFSARVIVIVVEPARHLQSFIGAGGVDEVHNNFVCLQGDASPIAGDMAE